MDNMLAHVDMIFRSIYFRISYHMCLEMEQQESIKKKRSTFKIDEALM